MGVWHPQGWVDNYPLITTHNSICGWTYDLTGIGGSENDGFQWKAI